MKFFLVVISNEIIISRPKSAMKLFRLLKTLNDEEEVVTTLEVRHLLGEWLRVYVREGRQQDTEGTEGVIYVTLVLRKERKR